jgi:hypothetical protein
MALRDKSPGSPWFFCRHSQADDRNLSIFLAIRFGQMPISFRNLFET